ncbi:hypothetical protein D4764_12G0011070 [Takifugu flavidus]|uniref:Uncharacterized protein n=1 Tax=Takifugu flavidus TaxID=433684 RepID=A0A5C6PH46_9TELE|nr:hypothetical protein D4764_12G0011070 [Takifugu flavidus]
MPEQETSPEHLQKNSDDTVIVGCVENEEDEYRDLVESFVRWSRENLQQLNVTKTKEMVVDFSKSTSPPSISGKDVEIVPSYKFWVFSWTTNWSGPRTLMLSTRRP